MFSDEIYTKIYDFKINPNLEILSNLLLNYEVLINNEKLSLYSLVGRGMVEGLVKGKKF